MKGNKAEVCNLKGGKCESRSIVMLVSHVEGWGGPEGGTEQQRADESNNPGTESLIDTTPQELKSQPDNQRGGGEEKLSRCPLVAKQRAVKSPNKPDHLWPAPRQYYRTLETVVPTTRLEDLEEITLVAIFD